MSVNLFPLLSKRGHGGSVKCKTGAEASVCDFLVQSVQSSHNKAATDATVFVFF